MKTLQEYLESTITYNMVDCHCHLFDANGITPLNHNIKKIGFMDIWFPELDNYTGNKSELLYNDYIKSGISSGTKLLATAPDPDQIMHIYENNKEYIKGFGELKCYDWSFGKDQPIKLPYKNLAWVREVCKYNKECLPVYIHYSLDKDNYEELERLFKEFSNIPFILCHCGMGTDEEYGFSLEGTPIESFQLALQLSKLNNVYLDISYTVATWIYNDPSHLKLYNSQKFLLGTDTNNQQFRSKNIDGYELHKKQEKIFLNLYKDFGIWTYFNYRKLFNR